MNLPWYVIRGSGIVAFLLLSSSLMWGLMVSTKVFGRAVKAKGLQWLHESLGLSAVLATLIHLVALTMDEFIGFGWADVLIPGVSEWEPLIASLGVVTFWTMVVVSFSFYFKKWLGQNVWRSIHYLSFGTFLAALIHGIFAGTDTSNPWVAGMYLGSFFLVGFFTFVRVMAARQPESRQASRRPRAERTSAAPEKEKTSESAE